MTFAPECFILSRIPRRPRRLPPFTTISPPFCLGLLLKNTTISPRKSSSPHSPRAPDHSPASPQMPHQNALPRLHQPDQLEASKTRTNPPPSHTPWGSLGGPPKRPVFILTLRPPFAPPLYRMFNRTTIEPLKMDQKMTFTYFKTPLLDRDKAILKRVKRLHTPSQKRLNPQREDPLLLLPGGHSLAPINAPKQDPN